MSLIKWEPFDDFDRIFRDMALLPTRMHTGSNFDLACDVYEDGDVLKAEMNLPGLSGGDIDVEVEDTYLKISGTREEVSEKKMKNHYAKEIRRGSFQRVVALPQPVDTKQVSAVYENGVLTVTMPKLPERSDNRVKVEVK